MRIKRIKVTDGEEEFLEIVRNDKNGKPTDFTENEMQTLRSALFDLSNRIRKAAEKI